MVDMYRCSKCGSKLTVISDSDPKFSECRNPKCSIGEANLEADAQASPKIVSLDDKRQEGRQTPKELLLGALRDLDDPTSGVLGDAPKLMIIALDDRGSDYNTAVRRSNLRVSECLALLEVAKAQLVALMNRS